MLNDDPFDLTHALGDAISMFPFLYRGHIHTSRKHWRECDRYFELWRFKQSVPRRSASPEGDTRSIVFDVGISRSDQDAYSFILMIDSGAGLVRHFSFPATQFLVREHPFEIQIGQNRFSRSGIELALDDGKYLISGAVLYGRYPSSRAIFFRPKLKLRHAFLSDPGYYRAVASLDHETAGTITFTNAKTGEAIENINFTGGRGYIDMASGRSVPESWIWLQANNFDAAFDSVAFSFLLTRIQNRNDIIDVLSCALRFGQNEIHLTSRAGAKIDLLELESSILRILLSDKSYKMEVQTRLSHEKDLGNIREIPDHKTIESLDSRTRILLKHRHGATDELIFDASSSAAGVEISGDIRTLRP